MKTETNIQLPALLGMIILLTVTGCGPSAAELTPTIDPNMIRTEAVSTFSSSLTQTEIAKPTNTPTLTPSPTSSPTPIRTGTAVTQAAAGPSTCYNLVYVQDVTVPDNAPMTPGQSFIKTWRIRNTGSCAIAPGFTFKHVLGDPMGGQPLTLTQPVPAGATTDLSINMTAPTSTGTVQGTWRMADANGGYFGDPLTVVIVIGGAASTTAAPTATLTPEP